MPPPHRAGPLGCRIGRRDELRRDIAGCTEGRIIECGEILLHSTARLLWSTVLVQTLARHRSPLIGVRHNQTRIHGKPFTANQPCRNAGINDPLEDMEEYVVTEPLIARPRECRMIEDLVLNARVSENQR